MVRRSKSDDYIGPAKGFMKWLNRFFRFILFPFIHPLFFVIILAVLGGSVVGIHYYYDVAYKDVPSWVWAKGKDGYRVVVKKYDLKVIDNIVDKFIETPGLNENIADVKAKESEKKTVVYESPITINRKAFKKAQDNPIDVKATIENQLKPQENIKEDVNKEVVFESENVVQGESSNEVDLLSYRIDNSFGLVYVEKPRIVKGLIEVVNANEIKINDELMFLYGIFVQPSSDKGVSAALYLKKITENKEAECHVVAFTQNADLTAVCVIEGRNINRMMVDMGYSQNVGMK